MSDFFLQLLSSAAVSAFLSGFVIWLTKSWISERIKNSIKNEYDEKLETHKAQLKAQADVESERLRSQLSIAATEHQVKFSRLHDKRAEVIAELYGLLVQAHWDAGSFISPVEFGGEPTKKEKYVTAMNAIADFFRFFEKNKIYLPIELCDLLEKFVQTMRQKVIGFGVYVNIDEDALAPQTYKKKHEAWMASWEYFDKEVPVARAALEQELRNILGSVDAKS
ncbi:hypothetical protein C3Y98_01105 [Methylotenera oryzisoli]|uniref:DUF4760 domain-containing protein n=1 Tax=Methylotenera oryzisoli TaxID=2080758 RepID=A0A4Y9VUG7_9PROT|nr:hypothetical protein [Methylotenera oryzisoli]TFW72986.1 hypothetical protein C3Y98_01105 [Methylotenera oryzisoli]